MKKISLSLIAIVSAINFSYAQSTFPTDGSNVGIGTTTPGAPLEINKSQNAATFSFLLNGTNGTLSRTAFLLGEQASSGHYSYLQHFSRNYTPTVNFDQAGSTVLYNGIDGDLNFVSDNSNNIKFYVGNSTGTLNEKMRLDGNGNLGIGTTSTSGLLTVGSSSNRGTMNLVGSSTNQPAFSISDSRTGGHQYTLYNGVSAIGNFDIFDQTASAYRLVINSSGNVLIGQNAQVNTAYKLDVNGPVRANEIVVNTTGADFVFEPTYKLPAISSLKKYIDQNHHLPEIPSAKQMQTEGLSVGENQVKLLQKVEELTLYLIDLKKGNDELKKQNSTMKKQIKKIQDQLSKIKNTNL